MPRAFCLVDQYIISLLKLTSYGEPAFPIKCKNVQVVNFFIYNLSGKIMMS